MPGADSRAHPRGQSLSQPDRLRLIVRCLGKWRIGLNLMARSVVSGAEASAHKTPDEGPGCRSASATTPLPPLARRRPLDGGPSAQTEPRPVRTMKVYRIHSRTDSSLRLTPDHPNSELPFKGARNVYDLKYLHV